MSSTSVRNPILRCHQCDALITGVPEGRWAGFARCPVCSDRMRREFGADPVRPKAKSPKSKAQVQHREWFARSIVGRAEALLIRGEHPYYQLAAEYSFGVRQHYARLICEVA